MINRENQIVAIVRVLLNWEDDLSDGYEYYGEDDIEQKLRGLAQDIIEAIRGEDAEGKPGGSQADVKFRKEDSELLEITNEKTNLD